MKLLFVYNADSGLFNTLTDIAHKLISPGTYQCNLCNLTHGYFAAREEWIHFLEDLDAEISFLHRDEYIKQHGQPDAELPAIFVESEDKHLLWVDKDVINGLSSTDALMEMIRAAVLKKQSGSSHEEIFASLPG